MANENETSNEAPVEIAIERKNIIDNHIKIINEPPLISSFQNSIRELDRILSDEVVPETEKNYISKNIEALDIHHLIKMAKRIEELRKK